MTLATPHPDVPAGLLRHPLRNQSVDGHVAPGRTCRRRRRNGTPCARTSSTPAPRSRCSNRSQGLPDLVFTANAAMIFRKQALLSRFRHRQRQGEEPYNRRWLAENGFEIVDVPEDFSFEGAGDALFCGDTLYAGYRMRSDASGHQQIGRLLGCRVIPVELVEARYYHLDTCFCPLGRRRSNLVSAGVRRIRPTRNPRTRDKPDRGRAGRGRALRLQRRRHRPARHHQHRLRPTARRPGIARIRTRRHAARRIRKSRRQRKMSHAPPRRRRSRRMEAQLRTAKAYSRFSLRRDGARRQQQSTDPIGRCTNYL